MRAVCALRFRAGKPHDNRGFRLSRGWADVSPSKRIPRNG